MIEMVFLQQIKPNLELNQIINFFFQFSRDLYWKESLVATFIPYYKRIDPEQEYLAEKINILT